MSGLSVSFPVMVMGVINTYFLVSSYEKSIDINKLFAVCFSVLNLLMIIPSAVANVILSEKQKIDGRGLIKLTAIVIFIAIILYIGLFDIILAIMGKPVIIKDSTLLLLIIGSLCISISRFMFTAIIRMGFNMSVAKHIGVLSIILYIIVGSINKVNEISWILSYSAVGMSFLIDAMFLWLKCNKQKNVLV